MAIEKEIKIVVDTKDAEKGLKKVEQGTEKVNESTNKLTGSLDKMTGGAVTKLKSFAGGLKGIARGFKSVGAAIAASGIGLLIITIAAITAAFKGSEEGQNKFAKLMSVIGAVVGNVVDVLADLGDFIIDLFSGNGKAMTQLKSFGKAIFNVLGLPLKSAIDSVKALGKAFSELAKGNIKGALAAVAKGVNDVKVNFDEAKDSINGATDALTGFIEQNIEEGKAAAKVADQRAKADKIERGLLVDRAIAEREIAELRLKAKDLNNVSAKEREAALLKVLDINDDLIARETEVLKLRAEAQIAENTFARSNKENLTAEEEAKAAVIAAETRRIDQQRQIQRELTAAQNEQASAFKAAEKEKQDLLDESAKKEKDRLDGIQKIKDKFDTQNEDLEAESAEQKLELQRQRAQDELDLLIGTETEKREAQIALNKLFDDKEEALKEEKAQAELDKDNEIFEIKREAEQERALIIAEDKAANGELDPLEQLEAEKEVLELQNEQLAEDYEAKQVLYADDKVKLAEIEEDFATEEVRIKTAAANKLSQIDKLKQDARKKQLALLGNALGETASLLGEATAEGKALAIASTTISTFQSAQAAYQAAFTPVPTVASPALGAIYAGVAVAGGLANIAKIAKVKVPKDKGSAVAAAGSSVGTPSAPAFNLVEGSGTNQIAEGIAGQNQPIEAFVVAGSVTTAQSLDRNIIDDSAL